MKVSRMYLFLATLGPIGYMIAPGTMATLVTIPFLYWLYPLIANQYVYGAFIIAVFFISLFIVRKALQRLKRTDDPSEIVLDEVVGCILTFWGVALTSQNLLIGFILFRFFDIFKFAGIKYTEKLNSEWGVMLDDIAAAILANFILRLIM